MDSFCPAKVESRQGGGGNAGLSVCQVWMKPVLRERACLSAVRDRADLRGFSFGEEAGVSWERSRVSSPTIANGRFRQKPSPYAQQEKTPCHFPRTGQPFRQNPEEILLALLADFEGMEPAKVLDSIIGDIRQRAETGLEFQRFMQQLRILGNLRNLQPLRNEGFENRGALRLCIHDGQLWASMISDGVWKRSFSEPAPLAVFQPGSTASLDVFPNPLRDRIFLKNTDEAVFVELSNPLGQLVFSGQNIEQADFSKLPPSVYLLKISGNTTSQICQLLKN